MKTPLCALLVLAILSVLFMPMMVSAQILESELIDRLVDLAPVLNTRDPKIRSLHLRGHVRGKMMKFHVECTYLAPRPGACVFADATDVPLVVLVEDRVMLYSPEVGIRQLRGGWKVEAGAWGADQVGFDWKVFGKTEDGSFLKSKSTCAAR